MGDNDGDGLTDFAAGGRPPRAAGRRRFDPGFHPPDARLGRDPNRTVIVQAGEFVFATAGDIDGDGYVDTVSSLDPIEGFPERERVYFGAPTGCAINGCREFSRLFITGHDNAGGDLRAIIAAAGDIDGDGGDDLVVATPENRTVYIYLAGGARGVAAPDRVPAAVHLHRRHRRVRQQPGGAVRHRAASP